MKFTVTFKNPDAVDYAISDIAPTEKVAKEMKKATLPWVQWGEYITVEFDTESGEATVVPAK